jgi:hypothetical protein
MTKKRKRKNDYAIKRKIGSNLSSNSISNRPPPNFNNEELFNYIQSESKKFANNYLKEVYLQLPDLGNAINSLNIDLDIPTIDTPNDADRLNLYNRMLNFQELYEKMPKALDKIYKDEPEIRELFPDLLEYQKLSKRLYEDLKNDNLLDKVIEYQKNDKIRTHLWSATIINMSSNLAFYPNQLIEVIDGKKLGISWPILVYSYIRDFELFFRFVVDPIV